MAARKSPAEGRKGDKIIRDALMRAVKRVGIDVDGKEKKKIEILANRWVNEACAGNVTAMIAIADRLDGKVPLPHTDAEGEPLSITFMIQRDPIDEPIDISPVPRMIRDK